MIYATNKENDLPILTFRKRPLPYDQKTVPPGQGVSISEAVGKYYGSLPKISRLTADGNPLTEDNMLEPQSHAPKPLDSLPPGSVHGLSDDDDDLLTRDIPHSLGPDAPSELGPEFVGHVRCEEGRARTIRLLSTGFRKESPCGGSQTKRMVLPQVEDHQQGSTERQGT